MVALAQPRVVSLVEASMLDSERLAEIARRAYDSDAEFGATEPGGPQGYDSAAYYTKSLRFLSCYLILSDEISVGGVIVGASGLLGTIERIFIDPDNQRQGIGSEAIRLLIQRYPDVALWTIGTPEWNTRTPAFLGGLGFKQVGWEQSDTKNKVRWYEKQTGDADVIIPIGSLKDGLNNVMVEGKVTEKSYPRSVRSKKTGETLLVANAALEDATGRVVMVLWEKQFEFIKVGARLRVENGYVNTYGGIKQLNIGYGRLITLI